MKAILQSFFWRILAEQKRQACEVQWNASFAHYEQQAAVKGGNALDATKYYYEALQSYKAAFMISSLVYENRHFCIFSYTCIQQGRIWMSRRHIG
jgi:hypothetical protein